MWRALQFISDFWSNPAETCNIVELAINTEVLPLPKSASKYDQSSILVKLNFCVPGAITLFLVNQNQIETNDLKWLCLGW